MQTQTSPDAPQSALTIRQWVNKYDSLIAGSAFGTCWNYECTGNYLVTFLKPNTLLAEVTPARADDFRSWLIRSGLAEATVAAHVKRARAMFQRAVDREELDRNPFRKVSTSFAPPVRGPVTLTQADIAALIAASPDDDWKALFALCGYAGLRRGEALRLQWADIEADWSRLHVRPVKVSNKCRPRAVRIEPELRAVLEPMPRKDGPIVDLQVSALQRGAVKIIEDAKVADYGPPFQALRRWRAETWRGTMPEHVVDAMMGHSLEVARAYYVRVAEEYFKAR